MGIVIDFDLSIILVCAIVWMSIVAFFRLAHKTPVVYLFFFTIFFIYIVAVLQYTQFPIYLVESMQAQGQNVWTTMNLVPLISLGYQDIQTVLFNILLTVPFGFGLPFVTRFNFYKVLAMGMFFSFSLEVLQLLFALFSGHTFRIVDINDFIFNSLGVAIGYFLFTIFINGVRLVLNTLPIKQNILLRYIYERPQISKHTAGEDM